MRATVPVRAILVEQTDRTRQSSKADIQRFIEESEHKITSLESQINALIELRDREGACLDSLRYIISPIRTLPIELLVEIFSLAIEDETHIEDAHRISQVCSDWRKVAHATPRLWTRAIRVDLGSQKIDGREQLYADGLEAWLARSAPLPVSISLELYRENSDPRILEEVLRIAPRFRSVHCPDFFPLRLIRRLAGCRLDSLEELELGLSDRDPNTSESPALTIAPCLRKARITIASDRQHFLIPWAQLTNLTLYCDSIDIILDILAQCTTLIYASLLTSVWFLDVAPAQLTRAPFTLRHLHTLSLDFGYPDHARQFCGVVSAPALEKLHIDFSTMRGIHLEVPLTALLVGSSKITRLEISSGPYAPTSHELIVALGHTTHLTHLKLAYPHDYSFDDTLIEALSCKDGVAALVPHLHDLVLDDIIEDGFATDALENMLVSRWRTDAEIRSGSSAVARWSHVVLRGRYSEQFMERMKLLQRKGLPLKLVID
ncbi:hypothetical protein MSAN_00819200 [Mycena sanguinolenta]|uniref:F-box domain-containing protein n=1 Tax=Mycena sanguinolenta TaxID=230812 RepID=A0A8H6YZD0_9AGAR|nr:hypothetical protein MSAN_00819200 [Mycena sanguinolenta]